jgi:hypothetical protein
MIDFHLWRRTAIRRLRNVTRRRSFDEARRALAAVALAAAHAWIAPHAHARTASSDATEARAVTAAADLDKAAYAFADRYATHVVAAADLILAGNPVHDQRRAAHAVKVVSVNGIYDIVTGADPVAKIMDLLMVVTLQSYRWIDEDMADKTFGARGAPLVKAMRELRVDVWNVAGRVLEPAQLQQLDALILDWRRRNPHVDVLAYLRFDEVATQRGSDALAEIRASGLFAEIASATKVADDARLLAERAFYQAKRMPFLITWQAEALIDDALTRPQLAQSLEIAKSVAVSLDRTSKVVEQMPERIVEERKALVALLEDRNGRLAKTMAEARTTIAAVDQLAERSAKLAEAGERLVANLRDTTSGLTQTTRAVDALMSKHAGPPNPNAKPFDIEPYAKASGDVAQTIAGLNTLIDRSDALLEKKPWVAPLHDADALFAARIDQVFVRALLLLVAAFVLALVYRWVTLRWAHRHGAAGQARATTVAS